MSRAITDICAEVNRVSSGFRMREFQAIRKRVKALSHVNTTDIFSPKTVFEDDGYAFHSGGRKELQYNLGYEDAGRTNFRFGVAFSMEQTRSLPDYTILMPHIARCNDYVSENENALSDMRMWYWIGSRRSADMPVGTISSQMVGKDHFVFIGKCVPANRIDTRDVLGLFDRLLPLYEYVESAPGTALPSPSADNPFVFRSGCPQLPSRTEASLPQRTLDIDLRHNDLVAGIYRHLCNEYGEDNVAGEHRASVCARIDLVVRTNNEFRYYEVKTAATIRSCIREALAQLLEYSFWPHALRAKALVIVSEHPVTEDAQSYLSTLRNEFKMPIYYQRYDSLNDILSSPV